MIEENIRGVESLKTKPEVGYECIVQDVAFKGVPDKGFRRGKIVPSPSEKLKTDIVVAQTDTRELRNA